jgi:DNA-binding transcriptional LysR family regulator
VVIIRKRLPPLNTIAAFEASARHLSFTRAAEELHLSQGAVSRQIQVLEERMGVPLFSRRHKEIQLTREGVIFQNAITESLGSIRRAVAMIEKLDDQVVTIAASVAMSSFWLMPAILAFSDQHPDINIRVHASDRTIGPSSEPIDLSIRYGNPCFPGMKSVKLFDEEIFPVCSRAYQQSHQISGPDDLIKQNLIEYDDGISAFSSWANWLKVAKIEHPSLHPSMSLSSYDLVYRAICAGKGVGLTWSYGVGEEVRDTLLVRPIDVSVKTGLAEHIVYSEDTQLSPAASVVLDWLLEHARASIWTV